MHWWNLIKSARRCSQSHFECHADWSGTHCMHQSGLGGGWFEQACSLALNRIIFPVATTLRSVDIQRCSRTGVNSTNIRNIVLIDHQAPRRSTEKRESGSCTAGWRLEEQVVQGCKETIRGCTRKKKNLCWALHTDMNNNDHGQSWLSCISFSIWVDYFCWDYTDYKFSAVRVCVHICTTTYTLLNNYLQIGVTKKQQCDVYTLTQHRQNLEVLFFYLSHLKNYLKLRKRLNIPQY